MNLTFDLNYAWRLLRKSWGYSLMCATVVALSVGLAVFTYTLAYAQLWKPLGLPDSDRWYSVQMAADASATPQPSTIDAYTYQEMLKHNRLADYVGAFAPRRVILSEGKASTSLRAAAISPRLFARVPPLLGRTFQDADKQAGAAATVILSFSTWQNYFAADPAIIGKTTRVDYAPAQVIGVLPQDFYAFQDFEIWLPLQTPAVARPGDSKVLLSPLIALGRNQNLHAVLSGMKSAVNGVNHDYPDLFNPGRHIALIPANRMFTHSVTALVAMIIFIAAAVLLLGSVNISMVFLARLLERSRELALRTALGSSRSRILRLCLLETALPVLFGLVAGYGLAAMGIRWYQWLGGVLARIGGNGRLNTLMVLRPVDLLAAVIFAMAIWLLSTLIPAWRIARQDANVVLAGSGRAVSSRGSNRRAGLLVGVQVVISCLVLVVCGSVVLAINEETSKPSGLNAAQVMLSTSPTVFDARYPEPARRLRYWEDLAAAIGRRIPGAEVAYASASPTRPIRVAAAIETQQGTEKRGLFTLPLAVVSESYFKLLGMNLRSGRLFDTTDNSASLNVAVVDEQLAARYWPGQDVLGKRVQLTPATNGPWLTIVGVVSAVAGQPYRKNDIGVLYQPLRQAAPASFYVLIRSPETASDERATTLRAAAFEVDRDLPLNNPQRLDAFLDAVKMSYKAIIPMFAAVAIITAVIAASGLFGLISRSVAQRTQEVGIRRALGATPRRVISMFLRQGALYLSMAVVGTAMGIMIMPLLSRAITNVLDYAIPVTVGVVVLMAAVVFAASYLPSRRAAALEPSEALRYE
jgi:putative ABC transport system permease protein